MIDCRDDVAKGVRVGSTSGCETQGGVHVRNLG